MVGGESRFSACQCGWVSLRVEREFLVPHSALVEVAEVSVSVNVDVVRLCVVDGVVDAAHVVVVFVVDASGCWVVGNGCRGMD